MKIRAKSLSRYSANPKTLRNTWQEDPAILDQPDGMLFSIDEWEKAIQSGAITSDDGSGYWCRVFTEGDEFCESDVNAFDSKPEGANFITWYNK